MSGLPLNWAVVPLSEIALWSSGGTPSRSNPSYYGGTIPWIKTGDLGERYLKKVEEYITEDALKNSSAKLFPANAVAMAMYGATIGKTSILTFEAATNQACAVAVPNGATTAEFLYYLLLNEKEKFISKGKGGAQPNISQSIIKEHLVVLPPLNEQKRIADKLDSILAKVDRAQARLEKIPGILKRFRQSVLSAAMSGELTSNFQRSQTVNRAYFQQQQKQLWEEAQLIKFDSKGKLPRDEKWKEKYQPCAEFTLPSDENLPKGWNLFYAHELCSVISDGDHNPPKKVQEGRKHLTVRCIQNGRIDFSHCAYVTEEGYQQTRLRYEPIQGDVLLTCIGSLGRSAIVTDDTHFSTDRNIAYLRLLNGVEPEFIRYALDSQSLQNQIANNAVGNAQQALYLKVIKELIFVLPPLDEQIEIVSRINSLFSLADVVEKNWKEAKLRFDRLTQSILAKAFRGELVSQDPNDVPASELLKQIKSSDIATKPKKKSIPKRNVPSTAKNKIAEPARTDDFEQFWSTTTTDLDAEKHDVIDRLRVSYLTEIQKAQELLVDAKFSVEQFRSITDFKGGYEELKALIMNLLKGIPSVSEPLLTIESWDEKSGDYLMRLVKQK